MKKVLLIALCFAIPMAGFAQKKKKKQQSILEKEIMSIMSKSMKAALDMALDDLLKDWK